MSTIVVGVDGSEGSKEALRFALDEARSRGADLKVVGAWHIPAVVYQAGWVPASVDLECYPDLAQQALDEALAEVDVEASGVKATTVVTQGQAADVLCAEAKGADLLVVGSRGLGGFRGLMLGSVSQQCAHHAPCALAIVPGGADST
ncbi:MAG TPA: universal stress protein [Gaiellaceae bacterium]|nr:universal stress protein [Gaiellaceae bacterium]